MALSELTAQIPDFGRDIRLNLESVLTPEGSSGLELAQIAGIALACAYSVGNAILAKAIEEEFSSKVEPVVREAAKGAATIMGMNNVYYRTIHLADDKEFSKLPARLRMNIIGKPGVPKLDFEMMSLAVSAIEGCGMCVNAHIAELRKANVTNEGIQSTIRIASVINAAKQALTIAAISS